MPPADTSSPLTSIPATNHASPELRITHHHHAALASLKLATYALDAMRVLHRLEAQAQSNEPFHQAIRSACPDWRNPGSVEEDPANILVSVMTYSLSTLEDFIDKLEEAWVESSTPAAGAA